MIRTLVGDITKLRDVEVIVNAANGIGVMGAGVAGAIARSGGEKFQKEVRMYAQLSGPFEAGSVYTTESGMMKNLGIQSVYHAVTMKYPGTQSSIDDILKAIKSACNKAISEGVESIAFPGLGTGIGQLDNKQVAQRMATCLLEYSPKIKITVVDINEHFINLFHEALEAKREKVNDEQSNKTSISPE